MHNYTVYRTINKVNNKVYIGFHSIGDNEAIIAESSDSGSIFKSGYLGSGKLIRDAIRKYGPDNFKQELLLVTSDKSEAEELERILVDREFVESDNTYNLSIGGNVTILYGDANGFYGKQHSRETIKKIQTKRNKTLLTNRFSFSEFLYLPTKTVYYSRDEFIEDILPKDLTRSQSLREVDRLAYNGEIIFKSSFLQKTAINRHLCELGRLSKQEYYNQKRRKECSERFKGKPKSTESNIKRSKSIKKWISENRELHASRMVKINKNPEKIAKTAATHRGMKRPMITRYRLAKAKLKSNIKILNRDTRVCEYIKTNHYTSMSNKSNYHVLSHNVYYDRSNNIVKLFFENDIVPPSFDTILHEIDGEIEYENI